MKYTVDALTPADEELLVEILEALSKRHGIRFAATRPTEMLRTDFATFEELPVAAATAGAWEQRLRDSEASGTVSWEDAQARFGL